MSDVGCPEGMLVAFDVGLRIWDLGLGIWTFGTWDLSGMFRDIHWNNIYRQLMKHELHKFMHEYARISLCKSA